MTSRRAEDTILPAELNLTGDEQRAMDAGPRPPFRMTRHWFSLLNGDADDPLRRQVMPGTAESISGVGELQDPLGEESHSPLPRLIHRYTDRALVVVTGRCALYCRHCFRRRLTGDNFGDITDKQAEAISVWLAENREVKDQKDTFPPLVHSSRAKGPSRYERTIFVAKCTRQVGLVF